MSQQRPDIRERLCALARQYDLVAIYAFGSRADEIAARLSGEVVETAAEYKAIVRELQDLGVLASDEARLLLRMAGYRNRLVRFYHEVSAVNGCGWP